MSDAGAAPGLDAAPQGCSAAAAAAPAPQPRVPSEGLSLAALRAFADAHAGREYTLQVDDVLVTLPFEQLTTAQVVQAVVQPATAKGAAGGGECTYAELLLAQGVCDARGRPHVGPATRFVSHAWSYPFEDLLAALLARAEAAPHAATAEDEYLWIDIFVGSQHKAAVLDSGWFKDAFAQAVTRIGHTLLVLQPWHAPLPLTRSWCLWELLSTVDGGAQLEIVLSPAQSSEFQEALTERFDDIATAMSKIDTRHAEAFLETDRQIIEAAVLSSAGGFEAVNSRIHDRLREWLAGAASDFVHDCIETLGEAHPGTFASMNSLANLLSDQGKLSEAEPLLRDALRCRREILGETHPDTLASMNNLASLLTEHDKLDEAEPLLRDALRGQRETLGETHRHTLLSMHNLGLLLSDQGKLSEAEPLYRDALSAQRNLLGDTHVDTLTTKESLAYVFVEQGKFDDAELLYRELLFGLRETLGEDHAATITAIKSLSYLLSKIGELHSGDAAADGSTLLDETPAT